MKYSQRWRQTTIANRMLVVSSVLLTFVTAGLVAVGILQYRTSKNQLGVMQSMIDQNERLIKASSDQATASSKSASVADSEKQAVLDSADAAKKSASSAQTLTEQNRALVGAARTQAEASQASAKAAEIQAAASKSQADASGKMVVQNERIVKAAETQAGAAQISAIIGTQISVAYRPELVSLEPNQSMQVDVNFTNKSSLGVTILGGVAKYVFTKEISVTTNMTDAAAIQSFQLPPQSHESSVRVPSRVLSAEEVAAIKEGSLHVFLFIKVAISGLPKSVDSCYMYNVPTKDLRVCY